MVNAVLTHAPIINFALMEGSNLISLGNHAALLALAQGTAAACTVVSPAAALRNKGQVRD
jgi:hypothetical protein